VTLDRTVALVATADDQRIALAQYLTDAGFDVHPCDELTVAGTFGAVVWLAGDATGGLVARVRPWLRSARPRRIVVVTGRPAMLRELVAAHPERLLVLPAPTFGWDLVDALRAASTSGPRGA
jgi:hypothetical protein